MLYNVLKCFFIIFYSIKNKIIKHFLYWFYSFKCNFVILISTPIVCSYFPLYRSLEFQEFYDSLFASYEIKMNIFRHYLQLTKKFRKKYLNITYSTSLLKLSFGVLHFWKTEIVVYNKFIFLVIEFQGQLQLLYVAFSD